MSSANSAVSFLHMLTRARAWHQTFFLCDSSHLGDFASNSFSSVTIRFYPRHPRSTFTKRLHTNTVLPLVPAAHRLASKRCYPFYLSFASPRLCVSHCFSVRHSLTYKKTNSSCQMLTTRVTVRSRLVLAERSES